MEWIKQEPGWYTSKIGDICKEKNGWWFYPKRLYVNYYGPFRSLKEAKESVKKSLTE